MTSLRSSIAFAVIASLGATSPVVAHSTFPTGGNPCGVQDPHARGGSPTATSPTLPPGADTQQMQYADVWVTPTYIAYQDSRNTAAFDAAKGRVEWTNQFHSDADRRAFQQQVVVSPRERCYRRANGALAYNGCVAASQSALDVGRSCELRPLNGRGGYAAASTGWSITERLPNGVVRVVASGSAPSAGELTFRLDATYVLSVTGVGALTAESRPA